MFSGQTFWAKLASEDSIAKLGWSSSPEQWKGRLVCQGLFALLSFTAPLPSTAQSAQSLASVPSFHSTVQSRPAVPCTLHRGKAPKKDFCRTTFWAIKRTLLDSIFYRQVLNSWPPPSAQRVPKPDPLSGIFFDTRPNPFNFENHQVAGNPKYRALPDISGNTRSFGYYPIFRVFPTVILICKLFVNFAIFSALSRC